jgi:hypothetical protein|tara:strand:- start:14988 stop:15320 length:333 start_codon:yes stop_codon:yes gene_type:complete
MPDNTYPTFGLIPFDKNKHVPQDLGLGGLSTEYLSTESDQFGIPFNFPTVWYDKTGKAILLPLEDARVISLNYEQSTGRKFPRFNTFDEGAETAMKRSKMGGATKGLLSR